MNMKKKQKADEEAERIRKATASSYAESRQKYSDLKSRQSVVHDILPLAAGEQIEQGRGAGRQPFSEKRDFDSRDHDDRHTKMYGRGMEISSGSSSEG